MKALLVIFFVFHSCTCTLLGQIKFQDTSIQSTLNLKKNDSYLVSIIHTKSKTEKGKKSDSSSLHYAARITVIDSAEDEFTIKWVYEFFKSPKVLSSEMQVMKKYYAGFQIIYKTDGIGAFKELVNWENVRDFYVKMVEDNIPKKEGDSINVGLEKAKAFFSSKDMVESALIKDIQLLHSLYGQTYSSRIEKGSTFMSTPISDEPVPAMVSTQVTEVKAGYYVIKTTQELDKTSAKNMFIQMFKKMGLADEKATQEAIAALASFRMSDVAIYKMNAKTGLPIKAVHKRTAGAAGFSQTETYEISAK